MFLFFSFKMKLIFERGYSSAEHFMMPRDVILSRWLRTYLVFQSDKSLALNRNFNQKDCLLCWDCPQRTQCYWPFLHRKFKFASFGWLGFLPFPCGSRLEMNFQVQSYIKNTNVSCEKPEAEWCLSPDAKVTAVFFSFIPADHRLLHLLPPFRELKLENSHTYRPSAMFTALRLSTTFNFALSFVC